MTFEEAVAAPGPGKFQLSSSHVKDGQRVVMIYSLDNDGWNRVAYRKVPENEHDALVADLQARGFPVAETDSHCDFVWVRNPERIAVYNAERKAFEATGDRATLVDGRVIARDDIARVIAYAAPDYVDRGIKAILRSGEEVDLVTELSMSAMGDDVYNRNDLLMSTEWCATLGKAIAKWAGTELENQILFPPKKTS